MKNLELFKTIEQLVQAKKQKNLPQIPSFAQRYCKQQIQKKKLLPHNPNSKMNTIMKNFYQLDTYINVQKLFDYIDTLMNQKKKQDTRTQLHIQFKSKQKITFNNEHIVEKVKEKLGDYYQQRHMKENEDAWKFLEYLEAGTTVTGQLKSNMSPRIQYENLLKNVNQNHDQKNRQILNSSWKYYERYYDVEYKSNRPGSILPAKADRIQGVEGTYHRKAQKSNLKERQQRKQLIHQVCTYLQIILQNKHKKKWGKNTEKTIHNNSGNKQNIENVNEDKSNQNISENKVQGKRPTITGARMPFQRKTVHKSNIMQQDLSLCFKRQMSTLNSTASRENWIGEIKSMNGSPGRLSLSRKQSTKNRAIKNHFTFRNRNVKQKLMKKLESFLDLVESEQKQFKKSKNSQLNQINQLQIKYKNNYNRIFETDIVAEDHEIKAVQNKVHEQK